MTTQSRNAIFRTGSTTYYYSSLFFPAKVKQTVFLLYAYVRTADNLVDHVVPDRAGFTIFCQQTEQAFANHTPTSALISQFVQLTRTYDIPKAWIDAFLTSMRMDLTKKTYSWKELETYMYGSAEIIGLSMAKLLKLKPDAYPAAKQLGKAMQLINFVRDIAEDATFGRVYLPKEDLAAAGLSASDILQLCKRPNTADKKTIQKFTDILTKVTNRYFHILAQAKTGFHFLPYRYRLPIQTASDMYEWTAYEILKNPQQILYKKIKPKPYQVILQFIRTIFVAL